MKKLFSIFLCLILLFNLLPLSIASAETQYIEVTKDSAPIRNDCYESGDVLCWASRGAMLQVLGSKINSKLNTWYRVSYDDPSRNMCVTGWIYSGNVREHQHRYVKYNYNGNTFCVCEGCKTISVEKTSTVQVSKANSIALALPSAAAAAAVDGPIPVGDIAALFILGLAYLELGGEMTSTQITEMVGTVAIDDYIRNNNSCNNLSFYKVARVSGGLVKIDGVCMNAFQAFLCSRYLGFDVWTHSPEAALLCASMNLNGFFGPERDKDKRDYYWHYHYGWDHNHQDVGTHVFYGQTENGQTPGF